jgi:hypothetical protein
VFAAVIIILVHYQLILPIYAFQETHIIHTFPSDFYGSNLKVCIAGYLRPEKNFTSLGKLETILQFLIIIHRLKFTLVHPLAKLAYQ